MMNNQRGVTLVEVLAAISILTLVLGVGFSLFASLNSLWGNTKHEYSYLSEVDFTESTLTREMADPQELYLISVSVTDSELRYKTFEGRYKALRFNKGTRTLSLYESIDATTFMNGNYVLKSKLADNVKDVAYVNANNDTLLSSPLTWSYVDGLIKLKVTFEKTAVDIRGVEKTSFHLIEISIKPFKKSA